MIAPDIDRPLAVGLHGEIAVGIEGKVTALTRQTVTIAGWTLPLGIGDGVHTVSTHWPSSCDHDDGDVDEEPDCYRDHCDDGDCEPSCECEQSDAMHRAIEANHDAEHDGSFTWCDDALCRAANGGAA